MSSALQIYILLVVLGVFLVGAEVFLPGGVLGVLGAAALVVAAVMGFSVFGPNLGFLSAVAIIVFAGVCIAIWVRYFPQTPMGRRLSLANSGKDFKSYSADEQKLVGRTGVAVTVLRPSGIAKIDGRRMDVVADGDWIEEGKSVRVVKVEGVRLLVRAQTEGGRPA